MKVRLALPTNGPPFLLPFARSIESFLQEAVNGPGVSSVTGVFTVTDLDGERIFLIEAAGLRVTLPSAAGNTAKLTFKLTVAGAFTIAAASGETIDGAASATLATQYEAVTLFSDGTDWVVLMAYQPMSSVTDALGAQSEIQATTLAALKAALFLLARAVPDAPDDPDKLIAEFS